MAGTASTGRTHYQGNSRGHAEKRTAKERTEYRILISPAEIKIPEKAQTKNVIPITKLLRDKNNRERRFLTFKNDITRNWKRGLWAVGIFLAVWIMVYFIAFMTALGNDTPFARMILKGVELFAIVANPLWGIPIAFLIGVYSKRKLS